MENYAVAGKTGTAEYSSDKDKSHSWFTGFSNVDNPNFNIMEFNYSMIFEEILRGYGLQDSYNEEVVYVYAGIYYNGNRIDESSVDSFLSSIAYYNEQQIYLVVRYRTQL